LLLLVRLFLSSKVHEYLNGIRQDKRILLNSCLYLINYELEIEMNILLIKPYSDISNVVPPIGLGYLSSSLKRIGMEPKIVHCYKDNLTHDDIIKMIKANNINFVGVTCCSNDHYWLQKLASKLEHMNNVYLFAGGPHATGLSKRLMSLIKRINFIILCEGEYAFTELVAELMNNNLDDGTLEKIPNLVWRDSSQNLRENTVELPADLDSLGIPDWEQMDPAEYAKFVPHGGFAKSRPVAPIITTRGCPYSCRYCASYVMNGHKIRVRNPNLIVEEIEYLRDKFHVKEIHIEDDNFTFNKEHVINLCSAIRKKGIKLNFGLPNGVRIDRIDKEILEELRNTGFYFFSIGIETGSTRTLKAMNKSLNFDKVRENIKLIRQYDFRIKGFFMIGYPGETQKDIMDTIQFAKSLDLDQAFFSIYIPLPGTIEFQSLESKGIINIDSCNWENYYTGKFSLPPYIPDGMTSEELLKMVSIAYRSFYLRPKIIKGILKDISSVSEIKHLLHRVLSLAK
jgi:anaerobic magnesium-protoporphyrin IX monomethyl ester cyclase